MLNTCRDENVHANNEREARYNKSLNTIGFKTVFEYVNRILAPKQIETRTQICREAASATVSINENWYEINREFLGTVPRVCLSLYLSSVSIIYIPAARNQMMNGETRNFVSARYKEWFSEGKSWKRISRTHAHTHVRDHAPQAADRSNNTDDCGCAQLVSLIENRLRLGV